jgi:hypothetical protein
LMCMGLTSTLCWKRLAIAGQHASTHSQKSPLIFFSDFLFLFFFTTTLAHANTHSQKSPLVGLCSKYSSAPTSQKRREKKIWRARKKNMACKRKTKNYGTELGEWRARAGTNSQCSYCVPNVFLTSRHKFAAVE